MIDPLWSASTAPGMRYDPEFLDYARCGLFPFDWSAIGNSITKPTAHYTLQASPDRLRKIRELSLPTATMKWLRSYQLGMDFRELSVISFESLKTITKDNLIGIPDGS
jgi:hypothetical protein